MTSPPGSDSCGGDGAGQEDHPWPAGGRRAPPLVFRAGWRPLDAAVGMPFGAGPPRRPQPHPAAAVAPRRTTSPPSPTPEATAAIAAATAAVAEDKAPHTSAERAPGVPRVPLWTAAAPMRWSYPERVAPSLLSPLAQPPPSCGEAGASGAAAAAAGAAAPSSRFCRSDHSSTGGCSGGRCSGGGGSSGGGGGSSSRGGGDWAWLSSLISVARADFLPPPTNHVTPFPG